MSFKKLLSAVGLLAVAVPASLSVVACGPVEEKTSTREERLQAILDEIIKEGLIVKELPTSDTSLADFIKETIKDTYQEENYDGLEFNMNLGDEKKDEDDNIISIQADLDITENEKILASIINQTINFVLK